MKSSVFLQLLSRLPVHENAAVSIKELAARWGEESGCPVSEESVRRWLNDLLQAEDPCGGRQSVVRKTDERPAKFHLVLEAVASWFMTEQTALNVVLTRRLFPGALQALASINDARTEQLAYAFLDANSQRRRLRETIRVVPDGLGRLPAEVNPEVLQKVLHALSCKKQLAFDHTPRNQPTSRGTFDPRGIVIKDGTAYLLATAGLEDGPQAYALQRMANVRVTPNQVRELDFDIDHHIERTQQFSHPLNPDLDRKMTLVMRVNQETILHFQERPFAEGQTIQPPERPGEDYLVSVRLLDTRQLLPQLVSMGPGLEVLAPPEMRAKVADWTLRMAEHYGRPQSRCAGAGEGQQHAHQRRRPA